MGIKARDCQTPTGTGARRRKRSQKANTSVSRSEEHTSELQSQSNIVCRLLLEKKQSTPTVTHTQRRQQRVTHSTKRRDAIEWKTATITPAAVYDSVLNKHNSERHTGLYRCTAL